MILTTFKRRPRSYWLEQLSKKVNYYLGGHIERLDDALAEFVEEPESLSEGSGIPKRATRSPEEMITDDDVRQMFSTLGSE
jgi:hypothetical protein